VLKVEQSKEVFRVLRAYSRISANSHVQLVVRLNTSVDSSVYNKALSGRVSLVKSPSADVRLLVFATEQEKATFASSFLAQDVVGDVSLVERIIGGQVRLDAFTHCVSTPAMISHVAKLGRTLGPLGLFPTVKGGTVGNALDQLCSALRAGNISLKVNKACILNVTVGSLSFQDTDLVGNVQAILSYIVKHRADAVKGELFSSVYLTSTNTPAVLYSV